MDPYFSSDSGSYRKHQARHLLHKRVSRMPYRWNHPPPRLRTPTPLNTLIEESSSVMFNKKKKKNRQFLIVFLRSSEPAPQVATYNNSETRQKIIEILASTANGCLAELGYFPGMPHKLKELELQNKNWQTENVKLFEDNKRLMAMLNSQTESLKWVKVPDMEKIQRIKDLEQENHALRIQREELLRRSIAEGSQSHQQGQMPYAQLQYEHSNLLETYRLAYNEVQRLRASIVHNPQLHQQEPIRIEQRHPTTSQNLSQFPMPVAAQVPHQALVQAPQQVTTPSPVTNLPMLQPTMQGRRHDLAHSQNAVIQRRQQQTVRMHRRAASGTIISGFLLSKYWKLKPEVFFHSSTETHSACTGDDRMHLLFCLINLTSHTQTQPARSPIQPSVSILFTYTSNATL